MCNFIILYLLNTSTSSEDIYNTYVKYINSTTYPSEYSRRLNYFDKFLSSEWKLPKDIMT